LYDTTVWRKRNDVDGIVREALVIIRTVQERKSANERICLNDWWNNTPGVGNCSLCNTGHDQLV
jgi:hypothetical protein